jgi:hypothetical protein
VAEVQNRLGPLVDKVDRQGNILRSLYANGSGGPPGYLEMARAEDKAQDQRLFGKINEMVERLDAVDSFIIDHNAREDQREEDRKSEAASVAEKLDEAEKRSNRRMTLLGIILAILMLLFAIYDHKTTIIHSLLTDQTHSQLAPQDAGTNIAHHY